MTRAYFPLRSSVELFRDPESPEPVTRAKQAAVLYDEVVFEVGLFDASFTAEGSFVNYVPRENVTTDRVDRARRVLEPGSGMRVSIAIEGMEGVSGAEEALNPFFEGELTASYTAEWHSGVLDELAKLRPDWAHPLAIGNEVLAESRLKPTMDAVKEALETIELPDTDAVRGSFLQDAFSRDAVVAAALQASVHVTSLFEPLILGAGSLKYRPEHVGASALGIVVPNVEELTWEAIAEFREHPGSREARERLREIEERALSEEPGDAIEFQERVGQRVTDDLFAVIDELRGKLSVTVAKDAASTAISLIPVAGPFLGPGASMMDSVLETVHKQRSWHAALMKLREPTVRA